jgi:hypothetical protein
MHTARLKRLNINKITEPMTDDRLQFHRSPYKKDVKFLHNVQKDVTVSYLV